MVGIHHRESGARKFAAVVESAEKQGLQYGVSLEPEPENSHDKFAIKVIGWSQQTAWLGRRKTATWHIGYVSAELAEELYRDLLSRGIPIAAKLYGLYQNEAYLGADIIVLAPPGLSQKKRVDAASMLDQGDTCPRVEVMRLLENNLIDEAISVLLDVCDAEERESRIANTGVAPWCYAELAKIFRKMKFAEGELHILRRFASQKHAAGATPKKLKERLEDLQERIAR